MEVGVIRRMLKRAKRWHTIASDVHPLKEPRTIGRALSYEEKLRLLQVARQNEEWGRAESAMSLALCTTMRGCEINVYSGEILTSSARRYSSAPARQKRAND